MTAPDPIHRASGDAHTLWFIRLLTFVRDVVGAAARARHGEGVLVNVWFDHDRHELHWQVIPK